MSRRAYALHLPLPPWRPVRLHRFDTPSLRAIRTRRDAPRWLLAGERALAPLIAKADAERTWRYESPGAWSAPVGPMSALGWRLRAMGRRGR